MLTTTLATLLLVAQPAAPAAQPEEFHAAFGLEPGVSYEIRMHRRRESEGHVIQDSSARLVLERTQEPDGPLVLLATIDLGEQQLTPKQARALGISDAELRSTAQFVLDEEYSIAELRNWEELGAAGVALADKMLAAQLKVGSITPEAAEKAKTMLAQLCSTHDGVLFMYSKRVAPYLLGYGWYLTEQPIVQEAELANPYGGDPLPATITTQLADNPDTPTVEYAYTQALDRERAAAMVHDLLASLETPANKELEAGLREMEIRDSIVWTYDPEAQLIRRAVYERQVHTPGSPPAMERWTWELVGGEPASP